MDLYRLMKNTMFLCKARTKFKQSAKRIPEHIKLHKDLIMHVLLSLFNRFNRTTS